MAEVTFPDLWINPVADLAAGMGFRCKPSTATPQIGIRIGQYGTRLLAVTTNVKAQQTSETVYCDSRDQVDFLEEWQGLTVCYRSPRGRKFYAVYANPNIPEQFAEAVRLEVTLTFNEVTFSEAV